MKDIDDLNVIVQDIEDGVNRRFKELDPNYKDVKLSKYKLDDFI